MSAKEAKARIKINKLLEEAGWRFFDDASGKANIVLEPNVKLAEQALVNANRELVTRFEKKIRAPLERVGGGRTMNQGIHSSLFSVVEKASFVYFVVKGLNQ